MADDSGPISLGEHAPGTPRRSFLARLSALLPALAVVRGQPLAAGRRSSLPPTSARQPNVALLAALAAAVLPGELGPDGLAREAMRFQRWMDDFRPGEELNHGYGTARIDRTPADPRPRWREQLGALDTEAQRLHGQGFVALDAPRRQAIVRATLDAERAPVRAGDRGGDRGGEGLPSIVAAGHVAVAMLAHFYDSTLATDLCYEAEIGRQQCRPLDAAARKPIPLVRRS